ncbi:hypothetical protein C8A03DRAFT_46332 [Achaetomium macrosporum]|uniref:Uncharacterized protein n=1 Tax=Achaetomium macrosporum TaxID=79813 RepID=A0AAN7C6B0_9PEZI|nr:hypothetical protein C8A03DRAFT_46332 [Achaetomium macrosporum]
MQLSSSESAPNEPEHPRDLPPAGLPRTQRWTTNGYPIIDGKYLDLDMGEVMAHTGLSTGGPPNITVYWQNRFCTGRGNQFLGPSVCKVNSLNSTPYSVCVVVTSELSQAEFTWALQERGLMT